MPPNRNMADRRAETKGARVALLQSLSLLGLVVWVFRVEIGHSVPDVTRHLYWAHTPVVPVVILALVYLRRKHLARALTGGSKWGLVLILAGLALLAVTTWPFSFGYLRLVAMVPVVAGVVLLVGGWRVLSLCLPMVVVLLLAVPLGSRKYASLMMMPERHTLGATRAILNQLPGVELHLAGRDLTFVHNDQMGTIALGEPRRGASLLAAYAVIGVLVIFARVRPLWQVLALLAAGAPIVLGCNLARMLVWGLVSIYGRTAEISGLPRITSVIASLLLAYAMFAILAPALSKLVVDDQDEEGDGLRSEDGDG